MNVNGELALITGGASGIGRGTALALARAGADIVLADVHDARLAAVSDEIRNLGRRVLSVVAFPTYNTQGVTRSLAMVVS